ncbi:MULTISPECIES: nucleotidyltransferase family protein [Sutcliffiella]|uniref:Nucleotidyltransferase n=1 Tax=Sutcliffiella cohnii TaxID=33932 RepID=A0A223KW23_9BACI|nr:MULTISPECIES: nucleotidyltransferase family protein [Sutcliffiella]AST93563.1 hypothetical protein BC6307_20980 [Sutcliffiella cohnii]WBL14751.1 nucleotidyltransferase family protein [Sutcliffiella sp. NC1]
MLLSNSFLFNFLTKESPKKKADFNPDVLEHCYQQRVLDPIILLTGFSHKERSRVSIQKKNNVKNECLKQFLLKLNETDVDYVCLKGLAMKKYYPKMSNRQSNDYDFLVKDINDFFKCYSILTKQGYTFYHYPVFTRFNNKLVGTVKFTKVTHDIETLLEINIGGFTISQLTWITDDDLWEQKQLLKLEEYSYYVPSDNNNLLIFLAETSGRLPSILRDHVDFYYMYQYIGPKKIEKLLNNMNDKHLKNLLSEFIKLDKGMGKEYKNINKKNMEWKYNIPKFIYRSPTTLLLYYFTRIGNYYVDNDKKLKLMKKMDDFVSIKWRFEKGIPITFIPISESVIHSKINWLNLKGHKLAVTPIGTFLLSGFCIVYDDEFDQITKLVEEGDFANVKYSDNSNKNTAS